MHVSNTIDCNGLSAAPTVLRIKQALVGLSDDSLPIAVLIDAECDRERIARSLGTLADDVYLATDAEQLALSERRAPRPMTPARPLS